MHFGPVEVIVIAGVIFLIIGYKKLPAAMKSVKDSIKIFKKEANTEEESKDTADENDGTATS